MAANRASVVAAALLTLLQGCVTTPLSPTAAISLLAASLRGKFACYPIPSAYYVPGTVIRIERDPQKPKSPKPDAEPILSLKSPITTVQSDKFADKWTVQWDHTDVDASLAIKFLSGVFGVAGNPEGKIAGKKGISIKAEMENIKDLVIFDTDRKTIEDAFQKHADQIQPDYLYYWIKEALLPEKVHFSVTPTGGGELNLPLKTGVADVSLSIKSQQSESVGFVASGVINCVYLEGLEIRKTAHFVGPPRIEIMPRQIASPNEVPLGRLQVR